MVRDGTADGVGKASLKPLTNWFFSFFFLLLFFPPLLVFHAIMLRWPGLVGGLVRARAPVWEEEASDGRGGGGQAIKDLGFDRGSGRDMYG